MEGARLMGQTAYIYEIGSGLVIDGEETLLCGAYTPQDNRTPHELITDSGAPALLLDAFDLEHHRPGTWTGSCPICSGGRRTSARPHRCSRRRASRGCGWWTTVGLDDGRRVYHLIPDSASKAAAVEMHMRARGYARDECIAVGDSPEDLGVAAVVGHFFLVANAVSGIEASLPNVTRTEGGHGDGFYEAVVQSLVGG